MPRHATLARRRGWREVRVYGAQGLQGGAKKDDDFNEGGGEEKGGMVGGEDYVGKMA